MKISVLILTITSAVAFAPAAFGAEPAAFSPPSGADGFTGLATWAGLIGGAWFLGGMARAGRPRRARALARIARRGRRR